MIDFKTFNEQMDEEINKRLADAHSYATVQIVFDTAVETARYEDLNGKIGIAIHVNPVWFATLTDFQKAVIIAHEVNHALAANPTPLHCSCQMCN